MSGTTIALIMAGCFIGLQFVFYFVITGTVIKRLMGPPKRDNDYLIQYETKEKKFDKAWLDIPFKAIRRKSRYGYGLFGRLYLNDTPTDKFILLLHGHNNSSIGQLKYLQLFRSLGYNVFLPDHRSSGESGGRGITFGHYEKYDVLDWIDYINNEYPSATFAIFGESMGAATATLVAARDSRIRFLIEYCGYANFKTLATAYMKSSRLYNFLSVGLAINAFLFYGVRFKEIDAFFAMQSLKIPTLIIHSKTDKVVAIDNAYALAKANPNAQVKLFEDSVHARTLATYPQEFTDTITEFVANAENIQQ